MVVIWIEDICKRSVFTGLSNFPSVIPLQLKVAGRLFCRPKSQSQHRKIRVMAVANDWQIVGEGAHFIEVEKVVNGFSMRIFPFNRIASKADIDSVGVSAKFPRVLIEQPPVWALNLDATHELLLENSVVVTHTIPKCWVLQSG